MSKCTWYGQAGKRPNSEREKDSDCVCSWFGADRPEDEPDRPGLYTYLVHADISSNAPATK